MPPKLAFWKQGSLSTHCQASQSHIDTGFLFRTLKTTKLQLDTDPDVTLYKLLSCSFQKGSLHLKFASYSISGLIENGSCF